MGHERTNSYGETVGTVQLRWEGECGNATSPFVILDVTGFGNSRAEEQGTIAEGRKALAFGKESACLFPGIPASPGTIGSLKWHCWKKRKHETKHFRGVLARDIKGLLKAGKGSIGSP